MKEESGDAEGDGAATEAAMDIDDSDDKIGHVIIFTRTESDVDFDGDGSMRGVIARQANEVQRERCA